MLRPNCQTPCKTPRSACCLSEVFTPSRLFFLQSSSSSDSRFRLRSLFCRVLSFSNFRHWIRSSLLGILGPSKTYATGAPLPDTLRVNLGVNFLLSSNSFWVSANSMVGRSLRLFVNRRRNRASPLAFISMELTRPDFQCGGIC